MGFSSCNPSNPVSETAFAPLPSNPLQFDGRDHAASSRPPSAGLSGWRLRVRRGAELAEASVVVRPLDGVPVSSIEVGRCSARRPSGEAGQLWLMYVVGGEATAMAGSMRASLATGDLALWPGDRAVSLHVPERLQLLVMALPPERWAHLASPTGEAPCLRIRHDSPIGPMLAGFFDGLGRRLPEIAERDGATVIDMAQALVTRWVDGQRQQAGMATPNALLARILAHADAHLGDPGLTPQALAAAHGMSVRSLHLLFEREGLRVAQWIRDRRLERCRETLSQPDWQGRIIDLALQWGFNDPSHFSRAFRQRYGRAPRQARGAAETARWAAR
jgi:AraC family transcriptional regulator, positive regulator of tynA and feaB